MSGTSSARIRQILIIVCLICTLLCSLIIMGLVGVNGKITVGRSLNSVCLLYLTIDGNVVTYNNGFCLFPIIAAAITAGFSLVFLIFLCMVLHRKDEFSPTGLSVVVVCMSSLLALLSFAVCGEIGLGLNKGCMLMEGRAQYCRSTKNFSSLYGAQITAGIMGGFWIIIMFLELFQLTGRPPHLATNTIDTVDRTTVVPSTKRSNSSHGISNSNITNPSYVPPPTSSACMTSEAPTSAPGPANVYQDGTYRQQLPQQPEMTSYQMNDNSNGYNQAQQQYYLATPQPQYQQGLPTPQMRYQQVQQTPQMAYQPQQAYPPPPVPQPTQPLQLQQPFPTYPTPASDVYPPQTVAVDTLPSSSGAGSSSTI